MKLSEVVKQYRTHNDKLARQQRANSNSESPEAAQRSLDSVIKEMRAWREQIQERNHKSK